MRRSVLLPSDEAQRTSAETRRTILLLSDEVHHSEAQRTILLPSDGVHHSEAQRTSAQMKRTILLPSDLMECILIQVPTWYGRQRTHAGDVACADLII